MFDKDEKYRELFNRWYAKLKRVAPIISLFQLTLILALQLYQYVSHREIFSNIYIGIFLLYLIIISGMLLFAHLWVNIMEMYRTETKSDFKYNPYATYAMTPRDEMFNKYVFLPLLEGVYINIQDKDFKEKLKPCIDKLKIWVKEGYIPREHFSDELQEWYLTKKKGRI